MSAATVETGTRTSRCAEANALLKVIASCGRKFFGYEGRVATLEVDARGRVWLTDEYTQERIFTHYTGRWRGFTNGGTLRGVVEHLREYITRATPLPVKLFGPWPQHYCDGDLWGYGPDMETVRAAAAHLLAPAAGGER